MIHIELKGSVPSKKNSRRLVCRGPRPLSLPSASYMAWHDEQMWALKKVRCNLVEKCEEMEIVFYPPTKRRGDLTNKAQSIEDLLVDAGILKDDNWFVVDDLHLKFGGVDKENPRAEVFIR